MKEFEHVNATSLDEAMLFLKDENAVIIAGGTDLLTAMKNNILSPSRLVNVKTISDLSYIKYSEDQCLKIGSLTLLNQIEKDEIIKKSFNILAQSAGSVATPQIRNVGTIGGNLCQKPRCWYYRNPNFQCLRKNGKMCLAVRGENRYNAIIDGGPCFMVHPSDTAIALIALNARVKILSPDNERIIPLEDFFIHPRVSLTKENVLKPFELITEIQIPTMSPFSRGVYLKATERKTWDFAIVSVAFQADFDGDVVNDARIVFGGVSSTPFRVKDAEMLLKGKTMDDSLIDAVSESAISKSKPLSGNNYKVSLAKSLIKQALTSVTKMNNVK
jgi:xanthine dehydrogenase YagS FAD-binding subunit